MPIKIKANSAGLAFTCMVYDIVLDLYSVLAIEGPLVFAGKALFPIAFKLK